MTQFTVPASAVSLTFTGEDVEDAVVTIPSLTEAGVPIYPDGPQAGDDMDLAPEASLGERVRITEATTGAHVDLSVVDGRLRASVSHVEGSQPRTQGFVVVRGGLVQNVPSVPVFDMDNLDSGDPGAIQDLLDELRQERALTRDPSAALSLDQLIAETEWALEREQGR